MILYCDWCGKAPQKLLYGIIKQGQDIYVCQTCRDAIRDYQALSMKDDVSKLRIQNAKNKVESLKYVKK